MPATEVEKFDFIIIGSGFGGSVSALRLAEKGYSVLILEKGRRLRAQDFPRTNWQLHRWLWIPFLRWRGLFKMTVFKHVTILSGVGVGGGSLVYANTLPEPKDHFFESGSWANLQSWKSELAPYYKKAKFMLGAAKNPRKTAADIILEEMAEEAGRKEHFHSTNVGVFFGTPGETVSDPYFNGKGPDRTGCIFCGGCMTGCRHGAKNSLDKNYLYFAEQRGAIIQANTRATSIEPNQDGSYTIRATEDQGWFKTKKHILHAGQVILAGGVLGTINLLLKMQKSPSGLPNLSPRLGEFIRTNSESLIGVVSSRRDLDLSEGVAITSILHTDDHSHLEPVRYAKGSGVFRLLGGPHAPAPTLWLRLAKAFYSLFRHPILWLKVLTVPDWAKHSQILLYMRSLEGTLSFRRMRSIFSLGRERMNTDIEANKAPAAFIPEASALAEKFASKVDGVTMNLWTETLMGTPSTAHILGGCCMGGSPEEGVINSEHQVYNYEGLYVIDGSAVSANPGVNPSLTITAMAERAMDKIPEKSDLNKEANQDSPEESSRDEAEPCAE